MPKHRPTNQAGVGAGDGDEDKGCDEEKTGLPVFGSLLDVAGS